jgi:hypothetical protein
MLIGKKLTEAEYIFAVIDLLCEVFSMLIIIAQKQYITRILLLQYRMQKWSFFLLKSQMSV